LDLFEYQGKELFSRWGVPVPEGRVVSTPAQARQAAGRKGARGGKSAERAFQASPSAKSPFAAP